MLGQVLPAALSSPSSGVKSSRALSIHSSFPSPYSPGQWVPPLSEITPVSSALYVQCEVTICPMEALCLMCLTLEVPTSGCFILVVDSCTCGPTCAKCIQI